MPIEGFSKYHICKNGRLYSIHSGTWKLIKPVEKSTGYISNNLISDLVVCHKDSNPRNNRVTNLYWGTQKENIQQCIREGKFYYVGKIRKKQYEEDFKRTHGMES